MTDAQTRRVLKNNEFGEIPNAAEGFAPKEIVHVIIQHRMEGDKMVFFLEVPQKDPPPIWDENTIKTYAIGMAKKGPPPSKVPLHSPLDISVSSQSWVVVQLGDSVSNWQYTAGELGCTTKAAANDRNVCLVHVYNDEHDPLGDVGGVVGKEHCKLLFFGVRKRGRHSPIDPNNPGSDGFNFHIEFVQDEKRLKVIFDPDVKNDSDTNTIPPGG